MRKDWINLLLFLVTVITTTLAGALMTGAEIEPTFGWFAKGFPFSIALLAILGIHELGHYFASRFHGVNATLPFFIPFPTIIGTFGAFIKIKDPIPERRSLFDIGFAGPAAGFVVAIPLLFIGLALSEIGPSRETLESGIALGDSIFVWFASRIMLGKIPDGMELWLHPTAFAAWIGLWVTSINLLPIGQLDGGHVAYAALGPKAWKLARFVWFALIPLGFLWMGWLVWAIVILLMIKIKHPPTIYDWVPLDKKRRMLTFAAGVIFIITFTPAPFNAI
jgi:membrane-associated protease RseP (regulator of RpoE activity)